MKRFWALLLSAALLAVLLSGCKDSGESGGGSSSAGIEIEAQTWTVTRSPGGNSTWDDAAERFAQLIADATNGAIGVEVQPMGEKTQEDTLNNIHAVMDGTIQISFCSSLEYTYLDPRFGAVSLPFLFDSAEQADAVLDGKGGEALRTVLEEYGLHCIGIGENEFRLPTNSLRPLASIGDFSGLKLRTFDAQILLQAYQCWGAETAETAWPMVFTALQTGTLDGQESTALAADEASMQQAQPYVTDWTGICDTLFLCMNKELFDSLSPEVQKIVEDCGRQAAEEQRTTSREKRQAILQKWGGTVTVMTQEDAAELRTAAQPCYDTFEAEVSPELFAAFTER